jgi:hypothetical protein
MYVGRGKEVVLNVRAPPRIKVMIHSTTFMRNWSVYFHHFPKYHQKILLVDFNAKSREKIFSDRQLKTRVYTKL